jgi:transcriptional repressor NrdR
MICPKCKYKSTSVVDSREAAEGRSIRRRRECEKCEHRFTTFEKLETANFIVIKKDGSRESYDREKVEKGIWRACEKRPVTQEQISHMLDRLEEVWSGGGKEVPSEIVGRDVMHALKVIDEVSYIRFASVYRQFKDVEEFKKELQKLVGPR